MAVQAHTHTHTHTLTSVQLSQPIGHHIGCSVEQRIGIIYSLEKKKGTLHLPVSKSTRLGSPHRLAAVCERELSSGYVQVPEDFPRLPQNLTGLRTPQFTQDVFYNVTHSYCER